jgi:hypothetical protein
VKKAAIVLFAFVTACSGASDAPYATSVGSLQPGATITVKATKADVNVYKPKIGEPSDRFTVAATALARATPPPAPSSRPAGNGVVVTAPNPLRTLLVRAPDKVNVVVDDADGNVSVTDISGNADVRTAAGNVTIMVSGYAQAHSDTGSVSVTMGATEWPGTLALSTGQGDLVVFINENARFRVRMHTDDGTLFSDFPGLTGKAAGKAETIDAAVNGGSSRTLDLRAVKGAVRLLRLTPQA